MINWTPVHPPEWGWWVDSPTLTQIGIPTAAKESLEGEVFHPPSRKTGQSPPPLAKSLLWDAVPKPALPPVLSTRAQMAT